MGLGVSGAYPGPGSFMISARGTNLDELIAKGKTPRDARELLEQHESGELKIDNLEVWKTDCPEYVHIGKQTVLRTSENV